MIGPVHFIWLGGGEWCWQYDRAIWTAKHVHGAPVILHTNEQYADSTIDEVMPLYLPPRIRNHPIKLANVKDLYAYGILFDMGGIYLDLDTISLRPAWDLLPDGKDLLVSREYHPDDTHSNPNNSAVMIGRKGAPVLSSLEQEAEEILESGEATWGAIGPHLVSSYAADRHFDTIEVAPYRALNGWSYHTIGDYYDNPRDPGEEVRVIHLYSSSYLDEFHADRWMPTT